MAINFVEQFKVYLEKNDGTVLAAPVSVAEISITSSFDGDVQTEIRLVSHEAVEWMYGKDLFNLEVPQTNHEWKCTWCGRVNQRKDEVCKSCGGSRSFLYGVGR